MSYTKDIEEIAKQVIVHSVEGKCFCSITKENQRKLSRIYRIMNSERFILINNKIQKAL